MGVPVKGTRFLPIKLPIPLEKSYNIPPHLRFTLSDLIECVHSCNQKLTCVIDLTYAKYYSSKFLHDNNIRYYKIYVEGHKVPDSKSVAQQVLIESKINFFIGLSIWLTRNVKNRQVSCHLRMHFHTVALWLDLLVKANFVFMFWDELINSYLVTVF
uniref:SJCHGC07430 protein n=1 Tax=Schistosoma japonicum TaxID=6182 RepID=Q5DE16_SCHJA|nr:SJCHGC07430 protein [Schistosoma japonicum]